MKFKFALFCTILLSACASVKHNYSPDSVPFSHPEVGSVVEAGLGEKLLDQGRRIEEDVLYVKNEFSASLYLVKPGRFIKVGEDDQYVYYEQDASEGILIYTNAGSSESPSSSIGVNKNNEEICIFRSIDLTICSDEAKYRKDKETRYTENDYRKTLIYSGRVDDKIRMSYREFSHGMARDAFTNDVEYDLSKGRKIGYAGAELKVISATNTLIKYKVISHFD